MTIKELENYILDKADTNKTMIAKWNYIRYTVYNCLFASIERRKEGIVLTVWGKFPSYEKEHAGIVFPAINNDPQYYSSVRLAKGNIPAHVIKSMIDYSYKKRRETVVLPEIAGGRSDIVYSGILPTQLYTDAVGKETAAIIAVKQSSHAPVSATNNSADPTQMIGVGQWNNVSYTSLANKNKLQSIIKLRKLQQTDQSNT